MGADLGILTINPGSTSTKVAVFEGTRRIKQSNLSHSTEELDRIGSIADQYQYRLEVILDWLQKEQIDIEKLDAVAGRGGLLRPIPGGTYIVTQAMIDDLRNAVVSEHASNLGAMLAKGIADKAGKPSFIVDPVAVDELDEVARISGVPEIERRSLSHALNIKAVAHRLARDVNRPISELRLIIAHLGGGISIAPLLEGRIIDVNGANDMGPFSPERAGGLPTAAVVKLAFSGKYTYQELKKKVIGKAGLVGYLGTNDARDVEKMIEQEDKKAEFIFKAMAYQIAKEIGGMATVLSGRVDYTVLTGGLAHSNMLVDMIRNMVNFIAPIKVYAGEDEMQALAEGALRVLRGEEKAKIYEHEVKTVD
jgi:butyrate kinase